MDPNGMASNEDGTLVDRGYAGCPDRPAKPDPPPSAYTNGVVTPHAAFLALRYRREAAIADLATMERIPGAYDKWGFADSINVDTPFASRSRLSLDQGMIMAAIGNALGDDVLRNAFSGGEVAAKVRPVLGVEEFNVQPRGCTITGTEGDDKLIGTAGDDVICGLGGNDTIKAGAGDDVVYGDAGNDQIKGDAGADTLYGDDGADRITGNDGEDVLAGGPGPDHLDGGPGTDHEEQGGG
jgi:hypothetical protein